MTQATDRRIRKLRVSSESGATLAADLHQLQDAFNIASFPGLPPNGLLLIRSFDLGNIAAHSSALGISRLLDRRLLALRYVPVCVDEQEAPQAEAVWFSDPSTMLSRLVAMHLERQAESAWYWHVICPEIRQSNDVSRIILDFAHRQLPEPARLPVTAELIANQFNAGRGRQLLSVVTPQLAHALLTEARIYPAGQSEILSHENRLVSDVRLLDNPWPRILQDSVHTWGSKDVRSRWLTISALVARNPAVLHDRSGLLATAETLLEQVDATVIRREMASPAKTGEQRVRDKPVDVLPRPVLQRTEAKPTASVSAKEPRSKNDFEVLSSAGDMRPSVPPEGSFETEEKLSSNEGNIEIARNDSQYNDPLYKQDLPDELNDDARKINTEHLQPRANVAPWEGLVATPFSGLLLLIPLLERLHIEDCLDHNPMLASVDLPARVLAQIARRFDIDAQHPLCQALPKLMYPEQQAIDRFIGLSSWVRLADHPHSKRPRLRRQMIRDRQGLCCISDIGNRLLLYTGSVEEHAMPAWHHDVDLQDYDEVVEPPVLKDIERSLQLLMSRYLQRYASSSLRALIRRPGYIAGTRTHLDLVFSIEQLDIELRRAGLDINPGWVSWLGRVVQIHYKEEDHESV